MRPSWRLGLIVGLACISQALQAREVRHLQPSGKWIVDYAVDSCRLARNFGDGDRQVALLVDQFEPGDWLRIKFAGKPIKPRAVMRPIKAVMRFGPNEAETEITGVEATGVFPSYLVEGAQRLAPLTETEQRASEEARRQNLDYEPPLIGAAREKAATWLELRNVLRFDLVLETGPMNRPLEALRKCSWDLVRGWGLDVEQQKNLSRHVLAKQSSKSWFSNDDYPSKMLSGGFESIVNYRLIVDESGKPESCHIQQSTRPKDFDDHVCRIVMKRARFSPALDAAGKPVRSYWRQTINFRIGG